MKTTYRDYPYPVLAFYNDDYPNKSFSYTLQCSHEHSKFKMNINFNLDCIILQNMISDKDACFLIHIECSNTRFREIYKTHENNISIDINSNNINDKVDVTITIISTSKTESFTSWEFNPIFSGNYFKIDKGDILAIACDQSITITKDDSPTGSSLFNITVSDKNTHLSWEIDNSSILIKLAKKDFELYNSLIHYKQSRDILTNMIIMPIITEILTVLKFNKDLYDDSFISKIDTSLSNIGYNIDALSRRECISTLSFKLMDDLLTKSLLDLESILAEEGDY
ncbi:hypothetical protein NE452_02010 [Paeniclostridium sordellii]|uniref:hypothetical protein n=1 Tax=Paraclostridium sordellii TaxID=1505 RepID=UPI0005E1348A|nr:hypothetical protein [Paeniclostridium sordellii]MCQ4696285.1 hypothetical protein [Paeniclostridium sordellii]CEN81839.1 Uncharacterised protein [[Clostridium] sordellii] [Paeniclostridium sordellii]CEO08611.1 Uncharacterised protein [[Clostridium] sordellii] [Paeniclostridium sordellii]